MNTLVKKTRLESLDVLRGFDLFMLVFFQPVFVAIVSNFAEDSAIAQFSKVAFSHIKWEGFHAWDLIMPLFLFMAGASIPFAYSAYKKGEVPKNKMFKRIAKRVFLLWLFGMIVQGNLLDLDLGTLRLYSNTLQSIAIGYLFASLIYMFCSLKGIILITIALPVCYTIGMQLYGAYLPGDNLAEMIDRVVLGRFVDGATVDASGRVVFAEWYNYAWIYPSLNFITTVLSGVLTTCLLRSHRDERKKFQYLLFIGVGCIAAAYALSPVEPIIKKLWTSTMTLLTSGYSILLLAVTYYLVDVLHKGQWLKWLKFYGMNSILAYMLYNTLEIESLIHFWFHGFEHYLGDSIYYVLFVFVKVSIIFLILRYCYRKSVFLKV